MKEIYLFVISLILFILASPNIFFKLSEKNYHLLLMVHSFIFTILFLIFNSKILKEGFNANFFNSQDDLSNFNDEEIKLCENIYKNLKIRVEQDERFNTEDENEEQEIDDETINLLIKELFPNITQEQIIRYNQYEDTINKMEIKKERENEKEIEKNIEILLDEKIYPFLNDESGEKKNLFNNLKDTYYLELGVAIKSMDDNDIIKFVHLKNEEIIELLNEIANSKNN
jgi:hypothetical protein